MNLKGIMDTIIEKKKIAETEIDYDSVNSNYKLGVVKRAKVDLEELYLKYRKEVERNALFILTTGSKTQTEAFSKIANEQFDCFTRGADELFERIADEIDPSFYVEKIASPSLFDVIGSVFEDIAINVGILSYPAIIFSTEYSVMIKDKKELIALIKKALNKLIGAKLVGLLALDLVSREAVNKGFSANIVPIILTVDQETALELTAQLRLITPSVFILSLGQGKLLQEVKDASFSVIPKATEEVVKETLINIKNNLK